MWDRMRLGIKNRKDPATRKLENEGLVKFHSKKRRGINKEKIKEFGRITYDFWSGVKYIVVLSALLWWIPLFGPMLAGYIGGRRTGGPKKGFVASIVGLFVIGLTYYMLVHGFLSAYIVNISSYLNAQIAGISTHTLIGPYTEFLRYYWSEFFTSITIGIPFGANSYVLTIIFAYIGGVLSFEKRKEYTDGVRSLDRVRNKVQRHADVSSSAKAVSSSTPRSSTPRSNSPRKSLKNLEAVKVNASSKGSGGNKKSTSESKEGSSKKKKTRSEEIQNKSKPKTKVKHHSETDGDDWQLL